MGGVISRVKLEIVGCTVVLKRLKSDEQGGRVIDDDSHS